MKKIDQPIIGYRVASDGAVSAEPESFSPADDSPLQKRIGRRPEGIMSSETAKFRYNTNMGANTMYVSISYITVSGIVDGKEVSIERPLEVFLPPAQRRNDQQWIAALMRSWSLAARDGRLVDMLKDCLNVSWANGPVYLQETASGKNRIHDSEVAAIAGYVLEMLYARGYVKPIPTEDGERVTYTEHSVGVLAEQHSARRGGVHVVRKAEGATQKGNADSSADARKGPPCKQSQCDGYMVMKDGCLTCIQCGDSKCS